MPDDSSLRTYEYQCEQINKYVCSVKDTQWILRRILNLVSQGESYTSIMQRLNPPVRNHETERSWFIDG